MTAKQEARYRHAITDEAIRQYKQDIERRKQAGLNIEIVQDKKRGQLYSDLWFEQNRTTSSETKNQIALLYLSTILDLDQENTERFLANEAQIIELVRLRHACFAWNKVQDEDTKELFRMLLSKHFSPEHIAFLGLGYPTQLQFKAFWQGLGKIVSGINTPSDITYLIKSDIAGLRLFLNQLTGLEGYNPGPVSQALQRLHRFVPKHYGKHNEQLSSNPHMYVADEREYPEHTASRRAQDLFTLFGFDCHSTQVHGDDWSELPVIDYQSPSHKYRDSARGLRGMCWFFTITLHTRYMNI